MGTERLSDAWSACGRLRQEDSKFETSLGCKAKLSGTGKLTLLVLISGTLIYRHCRRKHGLGAGKISIGLLK